MKQRFYNLETHSYSHPLYAELHRRFRALIDGDPRWNLQGYPHRNGIVVPSWHTRATSTAGQIRVQFLLEDRQTRRQMAISVTSVHKTNVGNKRKELASKARLLSLEHHGECFYLREQLCRVLVLDGDWTGPSQAPFKHLEMLYDAGWDVILSPDQLHRLDDLWRSHFNDVAQSTF